jgi:hypothetical protein
MAGAVLIYSRIDHKEGRIRTVMNIGGWLGAIFSVLYISTNDATPGISTLIPVLSAMLIIVSNRSYVIARPLSWLGDISFSFYLVHWPIILFMAFGLAELSLTRKFAIFAISLITASAMYYFYENPIRRSKKIAHHTLRLFVAAVAVSAMAATGLQWASAPTSTNASFTIDLASPIIYKDGCHLGFGSSAPKADCIFGDTKATRSIALVGDSHAAQWFPALNQLAAERHWKLYSFTKSSCPAIFLATKRSGTPDKSCADWQKNLSTLLNTIHPTKILISNFTNYQYPLVRTSSNYGKQWRSGMQEFIAGVKGSEFSILADTPLPQGNTTNIPSCLSKNSTNPKSCDFARWTTDANMATESLAIDQSINYVDPAKWLCTNGGGKNSICPAIFQGHNVLRDATHISVSTALALATRLGDALTL